MSPVPTLTRVVDRPARAGVAGVQSLPVGNPGSALPSVSAGRHLLDLPPHILSEHRAWSNAGLWHGQFDCAIWLRTPQGIQQPLQLVLRYVDNQGEKIFPIDRCTAGAFRTVLLNGSVQLNVLGRVRELSFRLVNASPVMEAMVDEWHLVPQLRR